MSHLGTVLKFHFYAFLLALVILYTPFSNDIKFSEFRVPSEPVYPEGNYTLNNAERLFEGVIRGPEGFAIYKGELYFSAHGGFVYKLTADNKLIKVLKTGQDCENHWWEEVKCGRPLGIAFDKSGNLYIVDTYYGIFVADLSKGKFDGNLKKIISLDEPISGEKPLLPNFLDVSEDGFVYWTDSSSKHKLHDGLLSVMTDGDGRLIKYNIKTKENTVLMGNLSFANGVCLSKDKSFLVVSETGRSRVHKYYLKGPKAGQSEIFLDNLPGFPDNIRLYGSSDLITISLMDPFKPGRNAMSILGPFPSMRKWAYKSMKLIDSIFIYLNNIYPHYIFSYIQNWVGHFESFHMFAHNFIKVFIVDNNGKIVAIHNGNDGKIDYISDFIKFNGYHYLGSPFNSYLGRKAVE